MKATTAAITVFAFVLGLEGGYAADVSGSFIGGTLACSSGNQICKLAQCDDGAGNNDGVIQTGEIVGCSVFLTLDNAATAAWHNVVVTDRFGAEWEELFNAGCQGDEAATLTTSTQGGSAQVRPRVTIDDGTLDAGNVISCQMNVGTDMTPGGMQSYTECGPHEFNSGATLKFRTDFAGKSGKRRQSSFNTGSLLVCVEPAVPDPPNDDCDGDGVFADVDLDDCDATVGAP